MRRWAEEEEEEEEGGGRPPAACGVDIRSTLLTDRTALAPRAGPQRQRGEEEEEEEAAAAGEVATPAPRRVAVTGALGF